MLLKHPNAFTLIETLLTIAILVIVIFVTFLALFHLQDEFKLNNETKLFESFIYQVQTKARLEKRRYSISLAQQDKNWCAIALQKNDTEEVSCNCLDIENCTSFDSFLLYKNHFQKSEIYSSRLYPETFINIDGIKGTLESKCLRISVAKKSKILQFYQYGLLNILSENNRSQCNEI